MIEYIASVVVVVTDGVFIVRDTVVQQFLVVDISFLHPELFVQQVGRIDRISYPCNVAEVILLSFVDFHVYVYCFIIVCRDTVGHDLRVTVTEFVVFVEDFLFVFFVFFLNELFGTEQVDEFTFFVGFFHDPFQLLVAQDCVSVNLDQVYFYFFFLVDVHVYINLFLIGRIFAFYNVDFGVLETFFTEMFLDQNLGAVNQVRSDLATFYQSQFCL